MLKLVSYYLYRFLWILEVDLKSLKLYCKSYKINRKNRKEKEKNKKKSKEAAGTELALASFSAPAQHHSVPNRYAGRPRSLWLHGPTCHLLPLARTPPLAWLLSWPSISMPPLQNPSFPSKLTPAISSPETPPLPPFFSLGRGAPRRTQSLAEAPPPYRHLRPNPTSLVSKSTSFFS
jgi:hypothetical protein